MQTNPHFRFLPIHAVLIIVTIQGITPDPCDLASYRICDLVTSLMGGANPVSFEDLCAEACDSVCTSTLPSSERQSSRTSSERLHSLANPSSRRIEIEGIALSNDPPARSGAIPLVLCRLTC